jgi:hypothetical protein
MITHVARITLPLRPGVPAPNRQGEAGSCEGDPLGDASGGSLESGGLLPRSLEEVR